MSARVEEVPGICLGVAVDGADLVRRIAIRGMHVVILHVADTAVHVDLRMNAAPPAAEAFPVKAYFPVGVPAAVLYLPAEVNVPSVDDITIARRRRMKDVFDLSFKGFREPLIRIDEHDPGILALVLRILVFFPEVARVEMEYPVRVFRGNAGRSIRAVRIDHDNLIGPSRDAFKGLRYCRAIIAKICIKQRNEVLGCAGETVKILLQDVKMRPGGLPARGAFFIQGVPALFLWFFEGHRTG